MGCESLPMQWHIRTVRHRIGLPIDKPVVDENKLNIGIWHRTLSWSYGIAVRCALYLIYSYKLHECAG